jgi:hypothetical protein
MKFAIFILAVLIALPCGAQTLRYIAPASATPAGSDSNNGVDAAHPWLTVNHALTAPTQILAIAGTYAASSFATFGVCTSASGDVCWLKCATFDACKITGANTPAMILRKSYWGVQGWEVSGTGNLGVCFYVSPTGTSMHHIILANNVCNGGANGFAFSSANSTTSFDYVADIGNIAWNAAQSTALCNSGHTLYEPIKSDSLPGTHIYVAGNFSFDNVTPSPCTGASTYDGEGIAFDDWGNGQSGGAAYDQQGAIVNNISVFNGGYGVATTGNGSTAAHIYIQHNTSTHNMTASPTSTTTCGDLVLFGYPNGVKHVESMFNLVQTAAATACAGGTIPLNAAMAEDADTTDIIATNWLYSAAGHNTATADDRGFVYGPNNITGTDPAFASITDPGAPNCSGKASVPDCMATVIANYTPTNAAAKAYGYQPPSTTSRYDALYPQWLCSVTGLPTGLVTPGCVTGMRWE